MMLKLDLVAVAEPMVLKTERQVVMPMVWELKATTELLGSRVPTDKAAVLCG